MATETFLQWEQGDVQVVLQAATLGVMVLGLLLGLWALHHHRAANFISAYSQVENKMQSKKCTDGRTIMGLLHRANNEKPAAETDWVNLFERLDDEYTSSDWYKHLNWLRNMNLEAFTVELKDIMRETFRTMDLVSILVVHSRVPGLREVFVIEWISTIIPVWVQGKKVLIKERKRDGRKDVFQCFREVYKEARLTHGWFPSWYPKRGLSMYVLRLCIHVCIVVKDTWRAIRNLWSSKNMTSPTQREGDEALDP